MSNRILEGLKTNTANGDELVTTTEPIDYNERDLLNSANAVKADLRNIDEKKGYMEEGFNINPDFSLYSLQYLPNDRSHITIAKNILSRAKTRGNPEFIHFLTIEGEINCKSVDLFSLKALDQDEDELRRTIDDKIPFEKINEKELTGLKNPYSDGDLLENYKQTLYLLSAIINCLQNEKTLYVCYTVKQYDEFERALFLALNILPKEISNRISFITAYGGGTSSLFNVVGVPIGDEFEEYKFKNRGLVFYYPVEGNNYDYLLENPLYDLLKDYKSVSEYRRFQSFIRNSSTNINDFDTYYNVINLYRKLNNKNIYDGDEEKFIKKLVEDLRFIKGKIEYIENDLTEDNYFSILSNLEESFSYCPKIANFGEAGFDIYRDVVDLLIDIYHASKIERSKKSMMKNIIYFLFTFNYGKQFESSLNYHYSFIDYLLKGSNRTFSESELIPYIQKYEGERIRKLLMESSSKDEYNKISCLYFEYYVRHLLNNYYDFNRPKKECLEIFKFLGRELNYEQIINFVFNNDALKIEDKFQIVGDLLGQHSDEDEDKFSNDIVSYIFDHSLIDNALIYVAPNRFGNREDIRNLREKILDRFLGSGNITTYDELKYALERLNHFSNNHDVYLELKTLLTDYKLNHDDFDTLTITSITLDRYSIEEPTFKEIISLFEGNKTKAADKILKAIEAINEQMKVAKIAASQEDVLITLRSTFVIRALISLPERTSKSLIKKDAPLMEYIKANNKLDILKKKKEDYNESVSELIKSYFLERYDDKSPNFKTSSLEKKVKFIQSVTVAQTKRESLMKTLSSTLGWIFVSIAIAGLSFVLGETISFIIRNTLFSGKYALIFFILPIVSAVGSFFVSFINFKSKKRAFPLSVFISIIESLFMLLAGLGLFILIGILMGGK